MATVSKCQAKDPRTCRFHGAVIRLEEAEVFGNALISGNAQVAGKAQVSDGVEKGSGK